MITSGGAALQTIYRLAVEAGLPTLAASAHSACQALAEGATRGAFAPKLIVLADAVDSVATYAWLSR